MNKKIRTWQKGACAKSLIFILCWQLALPLHAQQYISPSKTQFSQVEWTLIPLVTNLVISQVAHFLSYLNAASSFLIDQYDVQVHTSKKEGNSSAQKGSAQSTSQQQATSSTSSSKSVGGLSQAMSALSVQGTNGGAGGEGGEPPRRPINRPLTKDTKRKLRQYEYSTVDMANIIRVFISSLDLNGQAVQNFSLSQDEGVNTIFRLGTRYLLPPITRYPGHPGVPAGDMLVEYLERFFGSDIMSERFPAQLLIPFNPGGHWAVIQIDLAEAGITITYVDSLRSEEDEINQASAEAIRNSLVWLQEFLSAISQQTVSDINIVYRRIQPDNYSCGPIAAQSSIDLFSGIDLQNIPERITFSGVQDLRRQQFNLLRSIGENLDFDWQHQQESRSGIPDHIMFDEDGMPWGTMVGPLMTIEKIDLESGVFTSRFQSQQDAQDLYLRMLIAGQHNPRLVLGLNQKVKLPAHETNQFQTQALQSLADAARVDAERLYLRKHEQRTIEAKMQVESAAEKVNSKAEHLAEHTSSSKDQEKKREKEWEIRKKLFYSLAWKMFYGATSVQQHQFWTQYRELRRLRPTSFEPYMPFFTLLAARLELGLIREIIGDAYECNRYLTHASLVALLRAWEKANDSSSIFPRYATPRTFIQALNRYYPDDALVNAYSSARFRDGKIMSPKEIDVSDIGRHMTEAYELLVKGQTEDAAKAFVKVKRIIGGFSLIHYHLAFLWSLHGGLSNSKALEISRRASLLPDIFSDDPLIHFMRSMQEISDSHPDGSPFETRVYTNSEWRLLRVFINLSMAAPYSDEWYLHAVQFVDEALSELRTRPYHIPIVYFGIQWLSARLIPSPQVYRSNGSKRSLINSLSLLLQACAYLHESLGGADAWFVENMPKHVEEDGFSYGIKNLEEIHEFQGESRDPIIEFAGFVPTNKSLISFTLQLSRQLHQVLHGLSIRMQGAETGIEDYLERSLPASPTVFMELLDIGMRAGGKQEEDSQTWYHHAVDMLNAYLRHPVPPYPIAPTVLEWARFCASSFGSLAPQAHSSVAKIAGRISDLVKQLNSAWDALSSSTSKRLYVPTARAIQEASRGITRIQNRFTDAPGSEIDMPGDDDNPYDIFDASQRLFGWREGETFEEWGHRLNFPADDYLKPDYETSVKFSLEPRPRDLPTVSFPLRSDNARELYRSIREFWREFHMRVAKKNKFIAEGVDEDESDDEVSAPKKDWSLGIGHDGLLKLIQTNHPKGYRDYSRLSEQDKKDLQDALTEKHEHWRDVEDLKLYWSKIRAQDQSLILPLMAAVLMTNTGHGRREAYHSIYVENEETAESVYRLLVDIAADQLIRPALVELGTEDWSARNASQIREIFRTALNRFFVDEQGKPKLKFHGPEIHVTGGAPLQPHFNAGIVSAAMSLLNTHIYYTRKKQGPDSSKPSLTDKKNDDKGKKKKK